MSTITEQLPKSCCARAREYLARGGDPMAIFEFYRGDVVALRGPAWAFAKLRVSEGQEYGPVFVTYSPFPEGRFPPARGGQIADLGA